MHQFLYVVRTSTLYSVSIRPERPTYPGAVRTDETARTDATSRGVMTMLCPGLAGIPHRLRYELRGARAAISTQ